MTRLVLEPGTPRERSFPLRPGKTTIGRTEDNDIALLDKGLSRLHAEIHVVGDRLEVLDQASRNGTFVNGVRVKRQSLQPGDVLRLGGVELVLLEGDGPSDSSPTFTRDIHTLFFPRAQLEAPAAAATNSESRLGVMLQVGQLLASSTGLEGTLARVLELGLQILPVDRAAILLADENGVLSPRATRARVPVPKGKRIWSQGIVDHVMKHVIAALFADAKADPRIDPSRSVAEQGIVASMCAPLKAGDRVLGVLYADSVLFGRDLTQEDLDLLAGFANQAALAIDNAMLQERLRSEAVAREKLERFFPKATAERILADAAHQLPVVETRVTALFCDISGYSTLTSGWPPRQVLDLLNEYFPLVAQAVFDEGGTLEKYIGDALLAVWGAPFSKEDDADRAVAAAVAMMRAVRGKRFGIHIGLHTGLVAAGNIGTPQYLQYAAVGETTNLASRICGVAGEGEIVLSADTVAALRGEPPSLEALPPTSVKGHGAKLTLFRLRAS